jgi:hypothetical protein
MVVVQYGNFRRNMLWLRSSLVLPLRHGLNLLRVMVSLFQITFSKFFGSSATYHDGWGTINHPAIKEDRVEVRQNFVVCSTPGYGYA